MESLHLDVNKVTDLIASKFVTGDSPLSVLKLHKLLYYVEAWHLVFFNKKLFDDDFEAWVHGPVCRRVFARFKEKNKTMYSEILQNDLDIVKKNDIPNFNQVDSHIENVLETYGDFSGPQLEMLTHREDPWIRARGDLAPSQPCNEIISKESMKSYYSSLLR